MKILVTGGAGYIGGHTVVELLAAGHDVVALDNLSNSSPVALTAIGAIAGRHIPFVEGDIADGELLDGLFQREHFDAVVHFAASKAAGESVTEPLRYYQNNVGGTASLLACMASHDVKTIVFSSSAAVYGEPATMPINEDCPTAPVSPYGRTKLFVEELLRDIHAADADWRISILRYFNAVGAHPSGRIGEDPTGTPSNLMPFIGQVAVGRRDHLDVFGNDYPTPDGTCIRDYVHVVDLARGHVKALELLRDHPRLAIHNLGSGHGSSVMEVIRAFEAASGSPLPHRIAPRRAGDMAVCYADPSLARQQLDWTTQYDLQQICEDLWRWQHDHPHGFGS